MRCPGLWLYAGCLVRNLFALLSCLSRLGGWFCSRWF